MFYKLALSILAALTIGLTPCCIGVAAAEDLTLEELAGERLNFTVSWQSIPAASASMWVERVGDRTIFKSSARTLPAIRWIYPVDNKIISEVVGVGTSFTPRYYRDKRREGLWNKKKLREVRFRIEDGESDYLRNGTYKKTIEAPTLVTDPLSSFYAYRLAGGVAPENETRVLISDGKKLCDGVIKVVRRERVNVPAGSFNTVVIEPKIEGIGGIFKKSPGARLLIWLTDDRRLMPVRVESGVAVGSFVAELTDYSSGEVAQLDH